MSSFNARRGFSRLVKQIIDLYSDGKQFFNAKKHYFIMTDSGDISMDYSEAGDSETTKPREGYLDIGDFSAFAWSISGIETSVVVKRHSDKFSVCFDLGYSCRQNIRCDQVLISHGHMDHISAVPQHVKKRSLLGLKKATYFVPSHTVSPLQEACRQFAVISENTPALESPNIVAVDPGDKIKLHKSHYAVPFPTVHRVKSQGYLVYKERRVLKQEFQGLSGPEIGAQIQKGVNVHDIQTSPEIAFTGDTTFQVFTNEIFTPPPDLFKVKLLIVEATYINDEAEFSDRVEQARQWGHIHLSELYKNAELFKDVENILLIHMSDKYSVRYINEKVFSNVPEVLKDKIHVATVAKERYL